MPNIDPGYLNCSIYLYPNEKAAKDGAKAGGSGFLIAIPYQQIIAGEQRSHIYAVTNSHVISKTEGDSPVIRFNRHDGKTETIPYSYEDWIDFGEHDDLAVRRIDANFVPAISWLAFFPWSCVMPDEVFNRSIPAEIDIGAEVVMFGRFIAHDGKQRNLPVVRFGNISALPIEPIPYPNVKGMKKRPEQLSFLVEARSNPGTSGSPVFTTKVREDGYVDPRRLLGIVWGYSTVNSPILRKKTREEVANMVAADNSGMALVIPAWKLAIYLYRKDLQIERDEIERQELEEFGETEGGAAPAGANQDYDETIDSEFTEEDFEKSLRKVARQDTADEKAKKKKKRKKAE